VEGLGRNVLAVEKDAAAVVATRTARKLKRYLILCFLQISRMLLVLIGQVRRMLRR
jgi:hypothetical protein